MLCQKYVIFFFCCDMFVLFMRPCKVYRVNCATCRENSILLGLGYSSAVWWNAQREKKIAEQMRLKEVKNIKHLCDGVRVSLFFSFSRERLPYITRNNLRWKIETLKLCDLTTLSFLTHTSMFFCEEEKNIENGLKFFLTVDFAQDVMEKYFSFDKKREKKVWASSNEDDCRVQY